MKKLFIATRILFFLSFFLPFLLMPRCSGPSAAEKIAKENAKQDSIRRCDSAYQANPSNPNTVIPIRKDAQKPSVPEKHFSDRLSDIHSGLKYPTENTISGYGIAILSIDFKDEKINFLMLIMLAFIASIAGIFLLLIKHHHIIPFIISLCSVIFIITFLCILLFENIPFDFFLWGYWTSLALSLTNVVLAIILRKKRSLKKLCDNKQRE